MLSLYEESGTSSITLKSLGTSGDQQDRCTVSRTSLVTSRKAVKSLGRVLGNSCISVKSLGKA